MLLSVCVGRCSGDGVVMDVSAGTDWWSRVSAGMRVRTFSLQGCFANIHFARTRVRVCLGLLKTYGAAPPIYESHDDTSRIGSFDRSCAHVGT